MCVFLGIFAAPERSATQSHFYALGSFQRNILYRDRAPRWLRSASNKRTFQAQIRKSDLKTSICSSTAHTTAIATFKVLENLEGIYFFNHVSSHPFITCSSRRSFTVESGIVPDRSVVSWRRRVGQQRVKRGHLTQEGP